MARELEYLLLPAAWKLRVGVEGKSILIIDIASSLNMEHISTTGRGESLLQALFPSIIFTLVKAMMFAAAMAPMMLEIPSSCNLPHRIWADSPSEQRRRSSNVTWYVSRSSVSPRVQGSAIFTTPIQLRRYHILLVLQRTLYPRTRRGGTMKTSTPTHNLSTL